jgi:hypothetical protein
MLTIYDIAKSLGAKEIDGSINGGEFERLGLPMMGGCSGCGATIAAYNAHAGLDGYLIGSCCASEDQVFTSVEAFSEWHQADDSNRGVELSLPCGLCAARFSGEHTNECITSRGPGIDSDPELIALVEKNYGV